MSDDDVSDEVRRSEKKLIRQIEAMRKIMPE